MDLAQPKLAPLSGPEALADVDTPLPDDRGRVSNGRFAPGNPHSWKPGQSGNPQGRRRKGASFAAALARQALKPVSNREEMVKLATTIGLDPAQARNIDVVAGLFYQVLCRLLLRAASSNGRTDERLVGMLMVLLRALDPGGLQMVNDQGTALPIAAVITNVQMALGMHTSVTAAAAMELPALSDETPQ